MIAALPNHYLSPNDLPFNSSCLDGRFQLQSPDADPGGDGVWLILSGNRLLVTGKTSTPALPQELAGLKPVAAPLFVGLWEQRPCRLARISPEAGLPDTWRAVNLIDQNPLLPIDLLTLGGTGRMVLHWEDSSRHCGSCGAVMQRLPGEWGKACPSCGSHHFPRIHPCVIVLVKHQDKVLLARKPEWAPNRYSLVAGFLEFGESLEEAVVREVAEETGVQVTNIRYLGSQCWPFPSQVMTGFTADYASGELVVQESELEDAQWFSVDDLPKLPPKRSIARFILDKVLELP